jgi:colanic acid biosynthesis glycosyl transferase WcaI
MNSPPAVSEASAVSTGPRRILFVEQFFYPEGWGGAEIPRDIATHFARRGWTVEVICGSDQYAPVEGFDVADPRAVGVVIRRVPGFPAGGDIHSLRILRQAWFCLWAAVSLFLRRAPDVIVAQTNPAAALPLIALAARLRSTPFLLIAMDLYPEVLIASGALPERGPVARAAMAIFGWAYRSATSVVALGPGMSRRIQAKGVPAGHVVEISNWATGAPSVIRGEANRMRRELGLAGDLTLVYSGNLGVGHEFDTLLRGFAIARGQVPSLELVFIGGGTRLPEVRHAVAALGLGSAVRFSDFVPAERLPETLGLADLGVVTLRQGFDGLMVPSKLLGYLARGIPSLYIGPPGDAGALIERHGCGFQARNGDADAVARAILAAHADRQALEAMGDAARRAYAAGLTREHALARYEGVVEGCIAAARRQAA